MTATTTEGIGDGPSASVPAPRKYSIDWLRGMVMVLMALDHVRYFFSDVPFPPEDIDRTSLSLFLTRWVTHFCAPAFFFLAGTSAWLSARRRGAPPSLHLAKRGLLLVALELTVVGFGWQFTPGYSFAGVIWALGWSMIVLALCVRLPGPLLAAIALLIIGGHDGLSGIDPRLFGVLEPLWRLVHVPGTLRIEGVEWFVLYPLFPWCGVMMLGWATGPIWEQERTTRRRFLLSGGGTATALFILLRLSNGYGNPPGWGMGRAAFTPDPSAAKTLISLLNVAKYPASLQYLLMTLGPTLIALALLERSHRKREPGVVSRAIVLFGRVPLFYYVLHLYTIHFAALLLARLTGQPAAWLSWYGGSSGPPGYGYGLGAVYAIWLAMLLLLYRPCRVYDEFKRSRTATWIRFV